MRAYAWLCGTFGGLLVLAGFVCFMSFFRYQAPDGAVPAIPTGPVGFYFVAFTGCALVGWGGALLSVARGGHSATGRSIGTATSLALVMMALYRMLAWVVGDYYVFAGELLRFEAGLFLALAAAFLWLRPKAEEFA